MTAQIIDLRSYRKTRHVEAGLGAVRANLTYIPLDNFRIYLEALRRQRDGGNDAA